MSITRLPRGTKFVMQPVRRVEVQRAATGGARLPISYAGDHWAIEIETGALPVLMGRGLVGKVLNGTNTPVRVLIPQPGVDTGAPGSPKVAGGDQSGMSIDVDGVTPYYVVREGQFITIETDGSGRAYLVTAEAVANAGGQITLPIWPMLHVEPEDNATVEIAAPWIEGLIDEGGEHESGLIAAVTPDTFVIEEQD